MINSVKARTPILVLILFVFAVGYTFAANKVVVIPLGADAGQQSFAVYADGDQSENVSGTAETIRSVTLEPSVDGVVIVNSTVQGVEDTAGDGVDCSITTTEDVSNAHLQRWKSPGTSGNRGQLAGTRGFNVMGGNVYVFRLVCRHTGSVSTLNLFDSSLTAIFTPLG